MCTNSFSCTNLAGLIMYDDIHIHNITTNPPLSILKKKISTSDTVDGITERNRPNQSMFGPITILQIKGIICPCLTQPQDSEANKAITTIASLQIQFSTKNSLEYNNDNDDKKGVGQFVSKLFSNAAAAVSSSAKANDSSSSSGGGGGDYKRGRMKIIDSISGPVLSFFVDDVVDDDEHFDNGMSDDDDGNNNPNDNSKDKETISIPLKRIGKIEANNSFMASSDAGIIIYKSNRIGNTVVNNNRLQSNNNSNNEEKVELIRMKVFSLDPFSNGGGTHLANAEERDDVVEVLNTIVEWDRTRRKLDPNTAIQEDDHDEEEDNKQGRGNSLGQKALKAKYFIQKEIEMKKQVKDRESRKARYMKDSGGLKYTALAMANREMS